MENLSLYQTEYFYSAVKFAVYLHCCERTKNFLLIQNLSQFDKFDRVM